MQQARKYTFLLSFVVLAMVAAAVLFRQVPATEDWAPLFDIGALLGIVGLSFRWDRAIEPAQTRA